MHDCSGPCESHWDSVQWSNQYILRKLLLKAPQYPIYALIRILSRIVISAFFGEVQIIGAERIPHDGPVIFVGNHNNQFVDAFLMMTAIPRQIRFIIASVSMKIRIIGTFAKIIGAIEVQRPQDSKFTGLGKLESAIRLDKLRDAIDLEFPSTIKPSGNDSSDSEQWVIIGNCNTRFPLDCKIGDRLNFKENLMIRDCEQFSKDEIPKPGRMLLVRSIHSDKHMIVTLEPVELRFAIEKGLSRLEGVTVCHRDDDSDSEAKREPCPKNCRPVPFYVFPKMDQGMVYEKVGRVLGNGECICIFPEGGSHDRPDLLPLKPGVALFALQAYLAGVRDALIVPVGLHYFDRQRIGSAAIVEVGKPIAVTNELAVKFTQGGSEKQAAVNELLDVVRRELRAVTITADSYHILQTIQRCSEVYLPLRFEPTSEVKHKLQSAFTTIFTLSKHSLDQDSLIEQADEYSKHLDSRGFQDLDVLRMTRYTWQKHKEAVSQGEDWPETSADSLHLYCLLTIKVLTLAVCAAFALPALTISLPLKHMAAVRSTAAAMASTVKIAGVDVLASTKIQLFLTCIPGAAIIAALIGALATSHTPQQLFCLFPFYLIVTLMIIYYGLQLMTTVTNLTKQVQCYYTMCLSQASALEDGGVDLIARRNELQRTVRESLKKAILALSETDGNVEACKVLEAICPQYLIDMDTSERLLTDSACKTMLLLRHESSFSF